MFSMTTMELSTSIPTPTASPAMEMTLSVTPEKYISTMANVTLIGMDSATISVGLRSRRNSSRISTASAAPTARFSSTEPTTMRM